MRKPIKIDTQQQPAIEALVAVQDRLAQRDAAFAGDLIRNFNRWGSLSDKQMHWVGVLTQRATEPRPEPKATATVSFQNIQDLFDRASQKLRRVKVRLQDSNGTPVVFARAGGRSKYAGQIMITDGGPFGNNRYFGRIAGDGSLFATRAADAGVLGLVQEFAQDPATTAGKYGRLTGGCSFCTKPLKDDRSLQVGYGPVCARHFGLAWG